MGINKSETRLTEEQFESRKQQLERELSEVKDILEYEEDFTVMTVLSYLKENRDKFLLHPIK